MPWCPKCKSEYRESFDVCKECNEELVDSLDEEQEEVEYDHDTFLISVRDEFEAEIVDSLLQAEGIPTVKRYKGVGQYLQVYMGKSYEGIDIYVPSKCLGKGKEIISNQLSFEDLYTDEHKNEDTSELGQIHSTYSNIKKWGIILLLLPTLIGILMLVVSVIHSLTSF